MEARAARPAAPAPIRPRRATRRAYPSMRTAGTSRVSGIHDPPPPRIHDRSRSDTDTD